MKQNRPPRVYPMLPMPAWSPKTGASVGAIRRCRATARPIRQTVTPTNGPDDRDLPGV